MHQSKGASTPGASFMQTPKMFLTYHTITNGILRRLLPLIIIILTVALPSCEGGEDTEGDLVLAESAMHEGRYGEAAEICRDILQKTDSTAITVNQMCRIAVVYAMAADNDCDNELNMARAADCFRRAASVSADSVSVFLNSLSVEEQSIANMAHRLALGTHSDLRDYEDYVPDSIDVHVHE